MGVGGGGGGATILQAGSFLSPLPIKPVPD